MSACISSAFQAVEFGPIFTGFGYLPILQPSHHVLLLTGIRARTCGNLKKPRGCVFVSIYTPPEYCLRQAYHGFLIFAVYGLFGCFCRRTSAYLRVCKKVVFFLDRVGGLGRARAYPLGFPTIGLAVFECYRIVFSRQNRQRQEKSGGAALGGLLGKGVSAELPTIS